VATVTASGLGGLLNSAEFIPYVYGAASGCPSPGRPEKVLANPDLPQTPLRRLASEPDTDPGSPGRARTAGCGTLSGARRHYRDGEPPCGACAAVPRPDREKQNAARRAKRAAARGKAPA
jgi:hypothetical protein